MGRSASSSRLAPATGLFSVRWACGVVFCGSTTIIGPSSFSPSINARASFPRASISARPFVAGTLDDKCRWRRPGYPRARLALVGDANDGLRGGLRGDSFKGLDDRSGTPLAGETETEKRRGGSFRGLLRLLSVVAYRRVSKEILRGGCFSGLMYRSSFSGEAVFLFFLAGSSMLFGCNNKPNAFGLGSASGGFGRVVEYWPSYEYIKCQRLRGSR